MILKYVLQHFCFIHCSEVSSVGEPFCQGLKASLRVGVVVSWCDDSFFGSDTTAQPSSTRNEPEKLLSIPVSLMNFGVVPVSVMAMVSRLQKRRNWLSRGSKSWHSSMLLMTILFTETPDLLPLRIHPKLEGSGTRGEMRCGGCL